jgi:hypothetical protein
MQVWDREVEYQVLIKNDPSSNHDGETSLKIEKGQKIYYVVLNPAFFENEGKNLFRQMGEEKPQLKAQGVEELASLESKLLQLNSSVAPKEALSPSTKEALKKLKNTLEEIAWRKIYQDSLTRGASSEKAEQLFVRTFTDLRLKTIERHEAAHVYDLQNSSDHESPQFEKYTEMNAFYAELVYGENPHDVMAQAIVGLMDEMNQGKVVDHSIEKVVSVLQFLKTCPRFAKSMESGPLSKCCLEMLAKITRQDFIQVGQDLYKNHHRLFKDTFASL